MRRGTSALDFGCVSPGSRDQPDRGRMDFGEGLGLSVSAMGPIAATLKRRTRARTCSLKIPVPGRMIANALDSRAAGVSGFGKQW